MVNSPKNRSIYRFFFSSKKTEKRYFWPSAIIFRGKKLNFDDFEKKKIKYKITVHPKEGPGKRLRGANVPKWGGWDEGSVTTAVFLFPESQGLHGPAGCPCVGSATHPLASTHGGSLACQENGCHTGHDGSMAKIVWHLWHVAIVFWEGTHGKIFNFRKLDRNFPDTRGSIHGY